VAMRPAGGLPVMSNRAKRVLIALVGLAVAAIVWFLFVGVYVDWLWFGEVGFREVFATRAVTRIVLFVVAGLGGGGLVFASLYLGYRSRPVFVPTRTSTRWPRTARSSPPDRRSSRSASPG